jgi:fused signal recognition particle receptor
MGLFDFFKKNKAEKGEKLDKSLEKTKTNLFTRISKAVLGKSKIDDDVLDELEESLLLSDVGVETTVKIINNLRERVSRDKYTNIEELEDLLRQEISALMVQNNATFELDNVKQPYVIMVVGVNGVGKTTTIGKLAWQFKQAGNQVVLGAADTFRAAAVDQLRIWSQRVGVTLIEKGMGVDPAAVAFEAVRYAVDNNAQVVIIDTAGRLHNKKNLMNELAKIKRSVAKTIENAPHEVLLVLDASTGQNAILQAEEFTNFTEVTSLALTKLDGTAKGGVVVGISDRFQIPVKYIGVGEGLEDLQLFDPKNFVESLFKKNITAE